MGKFLINTLCACIPVRRWRKSARKKLLDSSPATQRQIREEFEKSTRLISLLANTLHDPDGLDRFRLLLEFLQVDHRFDSILYGIRRGDVCIDCGMHAGKFTDAVLCLGGISYGFEPNPNIFPFLSRKFDNRDDVTCMNKAVGASAGKRVFYLNYGVDSDGAGMSKINAGNSTETCEVDCIRLVDYIRDVILPRHGKIYILKLDVEGAEFEIIPDLIDSGLCEKIDNILCETHERFYGNGKEMRKNLDRKIREKGILNINLNWI